MLMSAMVSEEVERLTNLFCTPSICLPHLPPVPTQVPRSCQCMLMSATVSEEVERLTKLVLHNPVTLNLLAKSGDKAGAQGELAEGSGTASEIEHFSFECASEDKLLVTMAMLKLALVKKKVLIFVNTVDRVSVHGVCVGGG